MLACHTARLDKGLSQYALGQETRIHQTFISMIERGEGLPTPDQADRLAKALGLPVARLLERVEIVEEQQA